MATRSKQKTVQPRSKAKPKPRTAPKASKSTTKDKTPPKKLSPIEKKVAELLKSNDNGDVDNVWDIAEELAEFEDKLPQTSSLRPAWDAFYSECEEIMSGSAS